MSGIVKVKRRGWFGSSTRPAAKDAVGAGIECETFQRELDGLEDVVGTASFLAKLHEQHGQRPGVSQMVNEAMGANITKSQASSGDSLQGDVNADADNDIVVIDRQDAVEALASFIAEALLKCPQAANLPPKKLQEAVLVTIQGMKQSRFRQLCTAGRHAYRWGALGYSAFQMYSNPWICQAIITAVLTFSRLTLRNWV